MTARTEQLGQENRDMTTGKKATETGKPGQKNWNRIKSKIHLPKSNAFKSYFFKALALQHFFIEYAIQLEG
jgi:hypothetical protein